MKTAHHRSVVTRVRPIKKLFIIEDQDIDTLRKVIRLCSEEIAGIHNLIFSSKSCLVDDVTARFIKRHDPDVIVSFADDIDEGLLRRRLRIPLVRPETFHAARAELSSLLFTWDNVPTPLQRELSARGPQIATLISGSEGEDGEVENDSFDLLTAIHVGVATPDLQDALNLGAFGKDLISVQSQREALEFAVKRDANLLYLGLGLSMQIGGGSSAFEPEDNPSGFFIGKPTLIFGSLESVQSISYFWNTRATYPFNDTLFVPVERAESLSIDYSSFTHFCVAEPSSALPPEIFSKLSEQREIDSSRYYFRLAMNWWASFEETSLAVASGGKLYIVHPLSKLFSARGANLNYAIDILGMEEALMPMSALAGQLFRGSDPEGPLDFMRISSTGLTGRVREFDVEGRAYHRAIALPSDEAVFTELFGERGIATKFTQGTDLLRRVITLFGDPPGIDILRDRRVFDLLVRMTPKRLSRIVREFEKAYASFLSKELKKEISEIASQIPAVLGVGRYGVSELLSLLQERLENVQVVERIQVLYEKGVLLRGKSFPCPHCHLDLWLPLESLTQDLHCYGCGLALTLPVHPDSGGQDRYRINELLAVAIDQGILPVIVTVNFLSRTQYLGVRYLGSCVLSTDLKSPQVEADLVFVLGRLIGLAEVKADRGFEHSQVEKLLEIGRRGDVDIILFSTLKDSTSSEISDLVGLLKAREHILPPKVLILTGNGLFDGDPSRLWEYFSIDHARAKYLDQISII